MVRVRDGNTGAVFRVQRGERHPSYLLVDQTDLIQDSLASSGTWEPDLIRRSLPYIEILRKTLPTGTKGVLLDIGANVGVWSLVWSSVFPDLKIVAFEPQPDTFHQLCGNLFLNRTTNIVAERLALGSHEQHNTYMPMHIETNGNNGASRVVEDSESSASDKASTEKPMVQVKSLDQYFYHEKASSEQSERILLIKMDVEGFEKHVLQGAKFLLEKNRPIIFYECHPQFSEPVYALLKELNYESRKIAPTDCMAVPREHLERLNEENISQISQLFEAEQMDRNDWFWWILWIFLILLFVVFLIWVFLHMSRTRVKS